MLDNINVSFFVAKSGNSVVTMLLATLVITAVKSVNIKGSSNKIKSEIKTHKPI